MSQKLIIIATLVIAVIIAAVFVYQNLRKFGSGYEDIFNESPAPTPTPTPMKPAENSGLKIEILQQGEGEVVKAGDKVSVHYTGWLENGTKFDSSLDRGEPLTFTLGAGQVIQGWDQGVLGMQIGEKRKLTISPEMAYGTRGVGPIPPNATLIFEVELIGFGQ